MAFEHDPPPHGFIAAVTCGCCGLIYMNGTLAPDDVKTTFLGYNKKRDAEHPKRRAQRRAMYELDHAYAVTFINDSSSSILDVGCGRGDFLSIFSTPYKFGVDVDLEAIVQGRKKYPKISFYSSLSELVEHIQFDAIIFRGTLQYVQNLKHIAKFCQSRLVHKGKILLLAMPNADSLLAQLQREHWVLFDRIEHRYCFGVSQLQKLFGSSFKVVDYALPYMGTPYENYLEDCKNVLRMISNSGASKQKKVPFFGSLMNVVLEKRGSSIRE